MFLFKKYVPTTAIKQNPLLAEGKNFRLKAISFIQHIYFFSILEPWQCF